MFLAAATLRVNVDRMEPHYSERVRVAWSDTDCRGPMHVTAGLRYAENAEAALRLRLGIGSDWGDYPRRAVEAECESLPHFGDEVEVRIRLDKIGRTSITWQWEIWHGAALCMKGKHVVVHVDRDQEPESLPSGVRTALQTLLAN